MIRFDNVAYTYDGAKEPTLRNVSVDLAPGSFHFMCGPSGAGKTTLFRMSYMDLKPTEGSLHLFGKDVRKLSRQEISYTRRRMGIVFQDAQLLNHLTVEENVALPLSLHGPLKPEQQKCVKEILEWVGLGHQMKAYPMSLSGGEKQRVSIARAVVNRPKILLADEPTGNVDDAMGRRILHLFCELNRHGTTVLVATHNQNMVKSFDFPCIYLEDGKVNVPITKRAA